MLNFNSYVPIEFASYLMNNGYDRYSNKQLYRRYPDEPLRETHMGLELCALADLRDNTHTLIYIPTFADVLNWLSSKDDGWVISVMYDMKHHGFYYIVQNINTGYEYCQPCIPDAKIEDMYEWAIEHIVNRF